MRHQVAFKIIGVHAARAHFCDLFVIIVDPLTARRDLDPAEQQIKAERIGRIGRIVHRIKRAFFARVMRDEQKVGIEFLFRPLTEDLFLFRLKVAVIGDLFLELLCDDLFRIHGRIPF